MRAFLWLSIVSALGVSACSGAREEAQDNAGTSAPKAGQVALVRLAGGEAGPGQGSWLGMRGIFEPYREGKHFAVVFRVKNRASGPVTLLSATQPQDGRRLLRLIGVRFTLSPEEEPSDSRIPQHGIAPPYGAEEPEPLLMPPNREAFVQFNFEMGECDFFLPGEQVRYNEEATFRYAIQGTEATATLDLTGITVTVTAPGKGHCPPRR